MKTIHMIGNAHLDPVWLWPWQDGVDEALATYRTACDLLDDYPEFIFTHGEAWTYKQVERLDPDVFERIRGHVKSGRWEITGGWWIQPDCNMPSGFGFEHQIALGKEYFLDKFGVFPETGFNVDSFGHSASLPGYMRAAGQDSYVMMRPQEHEMDLPARLFRWRGLEDGPEVVTFRIAGQYGHWAENVPMEHFQGALQGMPDGIEQTMFFYGVGDHGGGPTARMIEWIAENRDVVEGCRLVFSSPSRFFQAISGQIGLLPLVTGELQMHAIGCYSVERGIKTRVRRAEHALRQAEIVCRSDSDTELLKEGWEKVCFNQFHDTLGGTCIPSCYAACYAQVDSAFSIADQMLSDGLRRKLLSLPDCRQQRIVMLNASDSPFGGYTEVEPWTQWQGWPQEWRLLNDNDEPVPFQVISAESHHGTIARIVFPVDLSPGDLKSLKIDRAGGSALALTALPATTTRIANNEGVSVSLEDGRLVFPGVPELQLPELELIEDTSDNWSHDIDRFSGKTCATAVWDEPMLLHHGPLMSALLRRGKIGESKLQTEWRVYAGESFAELRLSVNWCESWKMLKLLLPFSGSMDMRRDGISRGSLVRANDGKERPVRDWTMLELGESRLGVVCPDVFALDGQEGLLRFTLLRSPVMTHHVPTPPTMPLPVFADQGVHEFRFRFFLGSSVDEGLLESHGLMLQRPLIKASLTRGMPG